MCQSAITLISKALHEVNNAELLLKIKGVLALFIQSMEVSCYSWNKIRHLTRLNKSWGYSVSALDAFLLVLFERYAELLKRRFGEDFQEVGIEIVILAVVTNDGKIVSTDDYMPMPINDSDGYDKVVSVSWYTPEKSRDNLRYSLPTVLSEDILKEIRFPCVLPFSQMYPLCCIDIRNFLNQFYCFSDDHFQHSQVIDDKVKVVWLSSMRNYSNNLTYQPQGFGRFTLRKSVSVSSRTA